MPKYLVWLVLLLCGMSSPLLAQDEPAAGAAAAEQAAPAEPQEDEQKPGPWVDSQTAKDPKIDPKVLTLLVQPLTQEELKAELDAWLARLKVKSQEKVDKQIEALNAEGDTRARLNTEVTELITEVDDLADRYKVVMIAYRNKGGDVAAYEAYVAEVSGIDFGASENAFDIVQIAYEWLVGPGGIKWGLRLLSFLAVLVVFWILARIVGSIVKRATSRVKKGSDLMRAFFVNITRRLVMLIGIVIAVSQLGVDVGPLLAAIGAAGFIIGFALQGTLSNFAAGLMILVYRPFDVGDAVEVAGVSGSVEKMTLVSTTIKSWDNQQIIVPNNSIWGGIITNITGNPIRRVDMIFSIGYGDDIEKAQKVLEEIVTAHPSVLKDPEPTIKLHELGDSSVNFIVRPWSRTSDYWGLYWDITKQVKQRFDAEGISIPFPQRDVHLFYENAPAEKASA